MSLSLSFSPLKKFAQRLHLRNLADAVKKTIRAQPFSSESSRSIMWHEQCLINFPLLYFASIHLYWFGKERGCSNYLFATRDCCHWRHIFKALFPNTTVHYFDSSRNMLEGATKAKNDHYDNYVASLTENGRLIEQTVYVDIHGSGKRMFDYFDRRWNKKTPLCFLLTAAEKDLLQMPKETRLLEKRDKLKVMSFDIRGGPIEMLNYDLVGTCQTYNEKGAVRDKLEYDREIVQTYHDCMQALVSHLVPFDQTPLFDKLFVKGDEKYWRYLVKVVEHYTQLIERQKPIIAKKIRHVGVHPKKNRRKQ